MLAIANRRDFRRFVDEVVSHSHALLAQDKKLEVGQGLLKSYIVEQHSHLPDDSDRAGDLRSARVTELLASSTSTVLETEDPLLFVVALSVPGEEEAADFVVDVSDWRYWRLHTASNTEVADRYVTKLSANTASVDRAWFSGKYLRDLAGTGDPYKFVVNFDDEKLLAPVPEGRRQFGLMTTGGEDDEPVRLLRAADLKSANQQEDTRSVSLDLRDYRHLRKAFDELKEVSYFAGALNLTRMDLRYSLENSSDFSNERVYDWGKVTASGTSGVAHLDFMDMLVKDYRRVITDVEQECGLARSSGTGLTRLSGQPVNIRYRPIVDFETFVFNLFSGKHPFRMYGIPRFRGRKYAVVSAIDLHVQQPLRFEVAESYMTVVLQEHGCGNSIARLFTNLLRHYDANAYLYGRDARKPLLL